MSLNAAERAPMSPPAEGRAVRAASWWLWVWLAPWLGVLLPGRAGAVLDNAARRDFVLTFVAHLILLALAILSVEMWGETLSGSQAPVPAATTISATNPAIEIGESWHRRGVGQVWWDWHRDGRWGPAEWILLLTLVLGTLAALLMSFLHLPRVHRIGPLRVSFARTLRAVTAGFGAAIIATVLIRTPFVLWEHGVLPRFPSGFELEVVMVVVIPALLWLVGACIGRAVTAASRRRVELNLPPRCEGCGYDLTYVSAEERCTECGLPTAESLTPARRRPGSAWLHVGGIRGWPRTAVAALLRPGRFYASLDLRTAGSTERGFAGWNAALLAAAACACFWVIVLGCLLLEYLQVGVWGWPPGDLEVVCVISGFSLIVALGCWLGHRLIGAAVVSWWALRGLLPDCRWGAKVIAYESVYLWVFCAAWGGMYASFAWFGNWMEGFFGRRPVPRVGMPVEAAAFFAGTAVLAVIWLWRYRIARRAIQWSNF